MLQKPRLQNKLKRQGTLSNWSYLGVEMKNYNSKTGKRQQCLRKIPSKR